MSKKNKSLKFSSGRGEVTWVTAYDMDRLCGGPEEGGWWFDCGTVLETIPVVSTDVDKTIARLKKKYPKQGNRYSCAYEGGDVEVWCDTKKGRNFPREYPHYE